MNQLTLDEMQVLAVVPQPRTRDEIVKEVTSRWPSTKTGPATVRATITELVARRFLVSSEGRVSLSPSGGDALDVSFGHVRSLYQAMGRALGTPTWG